MELPYWFSVQGTRHPRDVDPGSLQFGDNGMLMLSATITWWKYLVPSTLFKGPSRTLLYGKRTVIHPAKATPKISLAPSDKHNICSRTTILAHGRPWAKIHTKKGIAFVVFSWSNIYNLLCPICAAGILKCNFHLLHLLNIGPTSYYRDLLYLWIICCKNCNICL